MNVSQGKKWLLLCCALTFAISSHDWMTPESASAETMACTDCHTEQQEAEFLHSPAEEGMCDSCHEATQQHLEEGGPGGMKTDRTAAACYQCHDAKDEGATVHPALMMAGECVQCHNPHGSANDQFLQMPKNKLCFECHDPVPSDAATGSKHDVVTDDESCLNCHDAHSSDQDALLLKAQKTLCLDCHNTEITKAEGGHTEKVQNIAQSLDRPYLHEPATWDEGCTECHAPHGSKYGNLLVAAFPEGNYNRYEPGDGKGTNTFELCFNCHDQGMLDETITGDATGFRNDTLRDGAVIRQNLHWLHVVDAAGAEDKGRGRNCNICHDPHGATQPHLVRAWWTMRSFQPILKFEDLPDGGECLRSCHSPKRYQRID